LSGKVLIPLILLASSLSYLGFTNVSEQPTISFIVFALSHLCLYFLVFHSLKGKLNYGKNSIIFILISSLGFRLLFFSFPISDDVNRYAWEGKNIWTGYNPYRDAPLKFNENILKSNLTTTNYQSALIYCQQVKLNGVIDQKSLADKLNYIVSQENLILIIPHGESLQANQLVANALVIIEKEKTKKGMPKLIEMNRILVEESLPFLKDPFYRGINHKEIKTVYPPLGILFFAGITKIHYSMYAFKIFFIVIDLAIVICLLLLVKSHQKPLEWTLLYAWSPLVLMYGAGESHLDVLLVFFLILSLLLLSKTKTFSKMALAFFFLGCAVMVKYLAIIALPFLLNIKNLKSSLFFLLPFATFILFWEEGFFEGLIVFSSEMHYNDSIAKLLRWAFDSKLLYQMSMLLCFTFGFITFLFFQQETKDRGIQLSWMWLLLCLPVLHPWYLLPVIALSCLHPSRSWFLISILMGLQFYVLNYQLNNDGRWKEFSWVYISMYSLFLLTLVYGFFKRNWSEDKEYELPSSLDIVIPVYNEEKIISNMISNLLKECKKIMEVIPGKIDVNIYIVDGGSTDKTMSILSESSFTEEFPVHICHSEKLGRGNQLHYGFKKGSGALVLFFHADSNLNKNSLARMVDSFYQNKFLAWGVLGHRYDVKRPRLKIIEILNYIRINWMGIGFGDQGMFFRRSVLEDIEVPQIPLMEDMEISLRLYKYPARINLKNGLIGSARRWEKRNFTKSVSMVVYLCIKFIGLRLIGVDVKKMSEKMYKEYYD